jgi:hypothetical protein
LIFLSAFGGVTDGSPAEDWCCDYDDSGAVGMLDYATWLNCYRDYIGNDLAGPPTNPDNQDTGDVSPRLNRPGNKAPAGKAKSDLLRSP